MYTVEHSPAFFRDVKKYLKQGGDEEKLEKIIELLRQGRRLPVRCKDHQLHGKMRQLRELHIDNDWLLVYEKDGKNLRILCMWLTSHKKLKERQRSL